jgi:hypothetical protein
VQIEKKILKFNFDQAPPPNEQFKVTLSPTSTSLVMFQNQDQGNGQPFVVLDQDGSTLVPQANAANPALVRL